MSFLKPVAEVASRAIATGVVGGGLSYAVLKRSDYVDIVGIDLPHYAADGILLIASSLAGDTLGTYILPWTEMKLGLNSSIQSFINVAVPPELCGGVLALGKGLIVDVRSEDKMKGTAMILLGSNIVDLLLGVGSKLAADKIIDVVWK